MRCSHACPALHARKCDLPDTEIRPNLCQSPLRLIVDLERVVMFLARRTSPAPLPGEQSVRPASQLALAGQPSVASSDS